MRRVQTERTCLNLRAVWSCKSATSVSDRLLPDPDEAGRAGLRSFETNSLSSFASCIAPCVTSEPWPLFVPTDTDPSVGLAFVPADPNSKLAFLYCDNMEAGLIEPPSLGLSDDDDDEDDDVGSIVDDDRVLMVLAVYVFRHPQCCCILHNVMFVWPLVGVIRGLLFRSTLSKQGRADQCSSILLLAV